MNHNNIDLIKDIAIIADFVISISAAAIKKSNKKLSDNLFAFSGVILAVAFVFVIIGFINK